MALERGRFGIEYKPRPRDKDSSSVWAVVLVVLAVAAVSFVATRLRRQPDSFGEFEEAPPQAAEAAPPREAPAPAESSEAKRVLAEIPARDRPPKVRNLLLRLAEAEKSGNVEMAATTIEALRDLPGEPAADLDDRLARRLGQLNTRWLFALANRQWVTEVEVRPRETAARIAAAHGSTLSSLIRLNALADADDLRAGRKIKVMHHPRFSMTVHRRARYADLHLNGKFFNRYDIVGDGEICPVGVYKTGENLRSQFAELGLRFALRDRVELETIIPQNASIVVSET